MGFFAVEDYIHHTTKNIGSNVPDTDDFSSLVSRDWLEKLMSTAVSKIIMLIRPRVQHFCDNFKNAENFNVTYRDDLLLRV